jgi:hypothetical protein
MRCSPICDARVGSNGHARVDSEKNVRSTPITIPSVATDAATSATISQTSHR